MATDYTDLGVDPESGLSLLHRRFCDSYLTHLNATRAYREAGYAAPSYDAARQSASDLLNGPHVRSYLDLRMKERADRLRVTSDQVLMELAVIGYSRLHHYQVNKETGSVDVTPGVPVEALGAIRSVKLSTKVTTTRDGDKVSTTTTHSADLAFWDKPKALTLLCQHLGLVTTELPPLEVLLNRLPPHVAAILRQLLAAPPGQRGPQPIADKPGGQ